MHSQHNFLVTPSWPNVGALNVYAVIHWSDEEIVLAVIAEMYSYMTSRQFQWFLQLCTASFCANLRVQIRVIFVQIRVPLACLWSSSG